MAPPNPYKWFFEQTTPVEGHCHAIARTVFELQTEYQLMEILETASYGKVLVLDGRIQSSVADDFIYHETLVHPAMILTESPRRVLVLGGGDGLALREVFKHPAVEAVTLVDIDPAMTGLSARFPPLAELNQQAFDDPRLEVVNQDALIWLEESGPLYDAVIIDFPDPHSFALGKLYTTRFYRLLQRRMTPAAALAIQCTSPLAARRRSGKSPLQALPAVLRLSGDGT